MAEKKVILCDTNIIIRLQRGDEKVRRKLKKIGFENLGLSIITHSEIYIGTKRKDFKNVRGYLNSFKLYHLDLDASKVFNGLILNYTVSHRIQIPDALIAATAISNNLKLYTENIKDFDFIPDLRLYR